MNNKNITGYFLFVSIFTLLTIFFFIAQKSYENLIKPSADVKKSDIIKSVDPNLDVSLLDEIEKRSFYSSEDSQLIPSVAVSPQ